MPTPTNMESYVTKRNFPKASKNDPSSEICPNDTVGGGGGIDNDVGGVLLRKYDRCPFAAIDELDTNKKDPAVTIIAEKY